MGSEVDRNDFAEIKRVRLAYDGRRDSMMVMLMVENNAGCYEARVPATTENMNRLVDVLGIARVVDNDVDISKDAVGITIMCNPGRGISDPVIGNAYTDKYNLVIASD